MSTFSSFDSEVGIFYDRRASDLLGKDYWRCTGFSYYVGKKEDNVWVHVPRGYLSDGASIPSFLWPFLPPWGRYGQAVVLHDFLCEHLEVVDNGTARSISRKEADDIFDEAMKVLRVKDCQRHALYTGVSLYRIVTGKDKPTVCPLKRTLEMEYRNRKQAALL